MSTREWTPSEVIKKNLMTTLNEMGVIVYKDTEHLSKLANNELVMQRTGFVRIADHSTEEYTWGPFISMRAKS